MKRCRRRSDDMDQCIEASRHMHGLAFTKVPWIIRRQEGMIPRLGGITFKKRQYCTLMCIQFRDDAFDSFQIITLAGYP